MKSFPSETSIRDFLKALASAEEAHDAVSAAAVAGGLGTSLLVMVASLPQTRSDSIDDRANLIADAQLGVALLYAAFSGARANLEGKLSSLTDAPYITTVLDEVARLSEETTTALRRAESFLQAPPA